MWVKDLEDGYFNIKIRPDQTKSLAFPLRDYYLSQWC